MHTVISSLSSAASALITITTWSLCAAASLQKTSAVHGARTTVVFYNLRALCEQLRPKWRNPLLTITHEVHAGLLATKI